MKNKKLIIILVVAFLIIVTISIYSLFLKKNEKTSSDENAKLLVAKTYSNYAWGFQFNGKAIFDNGSIYTWNESDNSSTKDYEIETIEGLKEYILNEADLKNKKVSKKDLKQIKEYISKIEDSIKPENAGADMGTETIFIIDENDNKIILKRTGDSVGENKKEEAQEILKIIEKYF